MLRDFKRKKEQRRRAQQLQHHHHQDEVGGGQLAEASGGTAKCKIDRKLTFANEVDAPPSAIPGTEVAEGEISVICPLTRKPLHQLHLPPGNSRGVFGGRHCWQSFHPQLYFKKFVKPKALFSVLVTRSR